MEEINSIQISPEKLLDDLNKKICHLFEKLKMEFQPKQPEEYLTRKELSELLKINISTIHNWCKEGILRKYAIGNRVYFRRSEIEKLIIQTN